jgi:hypothetical protein
MADEEDGRRPLMDIRLSHDHISPFDKEKNPSKPINLRQVNTTNALSVSSSAVCVESTVLK